MGLSPFSKSSFDSGLSKAPIIKLVIEHQHKYEKVPALPNPDPNNYEVLNSYSIRGHLLIEILYPDCTNYEGRKLLLFKSTTSNQLMKQGAIDPHFSSNKRKRSPFARFEPTSAGWASAKYLMLTLPK